MECIKKLVLCNYQGHSGEVLDARGSCDNAQILSGSVDKNVSLWDVTTSRMLRRWRNHNSSITCVQFNEESTVAISGSQDNSVKCHDIRSKATKEIQTLSEAKDSITSLAVTNHSILVGSADGYTRLYDLRQGAMTSDCLGEAVTSVAVSRDMASHLVAVNDETVKLIDKDTGQLLATYKGHTANRFHDYKIEVAFDYSDCFVFACSPFGSIYIWDLISENVQQIVSVTTTKESEGFMKPPVVSLATHPTKGKFICACGGEVYSFSSDQMELED